MFQNIGNLVSHVANLYLKPSDITNDEVNNTGPKIDVNVENVHFLMYLIKDEAGTLHDEEKKQTFFKAANTNHSYLALLTMIDESIKEWIESKSKENTAHTLIVRYLNTIAKPVDASSVLTRINFIQQILNVENFNDKYQEFKEGYLTEGTPFTKKWFMYVFSIAGTDIREKINENPNAIVSIKDFSEGDAVIIVEYDNKITAWDNVAILIFYIVEGFGDMSVKVRTFLHRQFEVLIKDQTYKQKLEAILKHDTIVLQVKIPAGVQNMMYFDIGTPKRSKNLDTYIRLHKIAMSIINANA